MDPQRQNRRPAGTRATAKKENSTGTLSHLFREFIAILAVGAMVGVMFWQSVFGMAADLAAGPLEPVIIQAHRLAMASGRVGE